MEERMRFIARRLEGESMTDLCREFGISRKVGCKIFERYKDHGLEALGELVGGQCPGPRTLLCTDKAAPPTRRGRGALD